MSVEPTPDTINAVAAVIRRFVAQDARRDFVESECIMLARALADAGWLRTAEDRADSIGRVLTEFGKVRMQCSKAWFPEVHTTPLRELLHLAMGTAEEGGEVLGVIKKWHRYTDDIADLDQVKLHDEMSDLLIYLSMLGVISGIDWDAALDAAFAKCVGRWGDPLADPVVRARRVAAGGTAKACNAVRPEDCNGEHCDCPPAGGTDPADPRTLDETLSRHINEAIAEAIDADPETQT